MTFYLLATLICEVDKLYLEALAVGWIRWKLAVWNLEGHLKHGFGRPFQSYDNVKLNLV